MPNLLSVNNYHYRRGGAEVVFFEQNRLFEEVGWHVAPFCMKHDNNVPTEWSDYFVDEIEFGMTYSLFQRMEMAQKIAYSFEARTKICGICDVFKPDIVHAHNVYHHISPSIFSALHSRGIPVVVTLHDLKLACPAYKMLNRSGVCERCKGGAIWNVVRHRCVKESRLLSAVVMFETAVNRLLGSYSKNVDRFVVPSRFYIEKLVEWGWPRDKFVHVPNFVDLNLHEPGLGRGERFVYFGRLGPEKGLQTLIRASAMAGVPISIVGSGPEESSLRRLVDLLGADVDFLGYQSGEALREIVRNSLAVVLPSEWYENAPMSVMEAYGLGRPVIGADIGGIPELIRPGVTGATYTSGDAGALAEVMSYFSGLPTARIAEMGRAGRSWMAESFSVQSYREGLLSVYRELGVG